MGKEVLILAEIKNGFYNLGAEGLYILEEQFIWEYKWFYHSDDEEVQLIAKELRTGKLLFKPLTSEGNMKSEIQEILNEETNLLKTLPN